MSDKEIKKKEIKIVGETFKTIEHDGQSITVEQYIPITKKIMLYRNYLNSYFKGDVITEFTDDVSRYIDAKYSLMLGIVDLCTSIPLENLDVDDLVSSGWWNAIRFAIKNYDDVMSDLYNIVKLVSDRHILEQSMSKTFNELSDGILDFISKIDLNPESIKQLLDTLQKESSDFKKDFVNPSVDDSSDGGESSTE